MNDSTSSSGMASAGTVTEALLGRLGRDESWPQRPSPDALVLTYVRAPELDLADPREFVLRPEAVWLLEPGVVFGFGRAPQSTGMTIDISKDLLGPEGVIDSSISRLAGRLYFDAGLWRLTTHATGDTALSVVAPGLQLRITNRAPIYAIRTRRLMISVPSAASAGPAGTQLEHRFTVFSPRIPEDAGFIATARIDPGTTVPRNAGPMIEFNKGHLRLLAAWAYPELIGLEPAGFKRGLMLRRLLQQSLAGPDPNERVLSTVRGRIAASLGLRTGGESLTPRILAEVVRQRRRFADPLEELHLEYEKRHPV